MVFISMEFLLNLKNYRQSSGLSFFFIVSRLSGKVNQDFSILAGI